MKKWVLMFLTLAMVFVFAGCGNSQNSSEATGQNEDASNVEQEETVSTAPSEGSADDAQAVEDRDSESNPLVSYFDYSENMGDTSAMDVDAITSASLDGDHPEGVAINNLLVIADEIQKQTGADVFSVRANETYDPSYDAMVEVAQEDQNNNKQFTFVEDLNDLSGYDTIYVGMPVWWSKIPQPMQVFLEQHDFTGKTIIPFGIHRGSQFGRMIGQLSELAAGATVVEAGYTVNATTANDEVRGEVDSWLESLH